MTAVEPRAADSPAAPRHKSLSRVDGFKYGLLGLPLAFVALPLYVQLPNHYAREWGMPLAWLGALLLGVRLFDAAIDPLLGRLSDHLFARSHRTVLVWGAWAAVALLTGMVLLFFPPALSPLALLAFAGLALVLTYTAYSALSIAHQAWGAMLGDDDALRSRVVAWREGLGLVGVVLAAVVPVVLGLRASLLLFAVALVLGCLAWRQAPVPLLGALHSPGTNANANAWRAVWAPWSQAPFRRLLGVFMLNGIASAVPATLVLFYVQDRLQLARSYEALFLGSYFVCAALSIPVWLQVVARLGLARAWGVGILLAIGAFVWAAILGSGDSAAYLAVCAFSGLALGADLAMPSALLAGVIAKAAPGGGSAGAYFGWWNFASKLNLALAAGLALPFLALWGYTPGSRDPVALGALTAAYSLLPCLLKLMAAAALYRWIIAPQHLIQHP